ncbi:hypothetical protein BD309DRAFT_1012757 [Dichomitus squalens]|nr:hypothetical protein BD309DRAFT_1012757 [Dichomitus squalens]
MALPPKFHTWLCSLFAALRLVTFGYDLGIIASVLPLEDFLETTGHPDSTAQGLIVGCLLLGAFASNVYVGSLAGMIGRRASILAGCVVFLLGGSIQAGARNIHYIYRGRFLAGMGIGMLAMLAPWYQAEIAHPSIRGRLTTLQQFMPGIGALVASFIEYGSYHGLSGQAQWRLPLGTLHVVGVYKALTRDYVYQSSVDGLISAAIPLAFFILWSLSYNSRDDPKRRIATFGRGCKRRSQEALRLAIPKTEIYAQQCHAGHVPEPVAGFQKCMSRGSVDEFGLRHGRIAGSEPGDKRMGKKARDVLENAHEPRGQGEEIEII